MASSESNPSQLDNSVKQEPKEEPLVIPDKWRRLTKILELHSWKVDRISGSHHIFVKPGHRCIPLAFHGGSLSRCYAKLVLRQAGIVADDDDELFSIQDNTIETFSREFQHVSTHDVLSNGKAEVQNSDKNSRQVPGPRPLAQITQDDKVLLEMQQEKEKEEDAAEELRRQELLERVQNDIATGNYESAAATIDSEGIDFVGSSDEKYGFSSSLMFYKLVCLTECAFAEHPFNSKEQHESTLEALELSFEYMKAVCGRRQEVRSLVMALQERIIKLYLDGAQQAFAKYLAVVLRDNPIVDNLPIFMLPKEEVHHTQEFVYEQFATMLSCLQFMISMYKLVKRQPFCAARTIEMMEELNIAGFISPCIKTMLILFDLGDFDAASGAADTLLFVAEHFRHGIDMIDSLCLFIPEGDRTTSELVCGISQHVKGLVPAYRFAKSEMGWSRLAGMRARCKQKGDFDEIENMVQRCQLDIFNALKFTDMVINAIEASSDCIRALIVSNHTKTFMFDSLIDLVEILKATTLLIAGSKKSIIGKAGLQFLKDFAKSDCRGLLEYAMESRYSKLKEFRKSKYDQLRRGIILLFTRLQKLSDIFSTYYGFLDDKGLQRIDGSDMKYLFPFRFECINEIRCSLAQLFHLVFDVTSMGPMMILPHVSILLTDLDVAQRFRTDVSRRFRGQCESSGEVLAIGRFSFDSVFRSLIPALLQRFVIASEGKRLVVIDRLGANSLTVDTMTIATLSQLGLDCPTFLESTAFAVLVELLKFTGTSPSESFIRRCLDKLAADSTKTPAYHRWIKSRSKKYTKKIEQLKKSAMNLDQHTKLSSCLASRETAVNAL